MLLKHVLTEMNPLASETTWQWKITGCPLLSVPLSTLQDTWWGVASITYTSISSGWILETFQGVERQNIYKKRTGPQKIISV